MHGKSEEFDYDVVVVGAGPAGSTAALQLARAGVRVALFEKETFPRFHIGESLLAKTMIQLKALGLADRMAGIPTVRKVGAEFVLGDGSYGNDYLFRTSLDHEDEFETFNVERALFDREILLAAEEAGAEVFQGVRVEGVESMADGDVRLRTARGPLRCRFLLDASGILTQLGKHLRMRRPHPFLRNIAYYGHFTDVERRPGEPGGFATIVMCDEGWFWIIPINDTVTSIGLVIQERHARAVGLPAREMLAWGIRNCPVVAERCRDATFPETTYVTGDYSHSCDPYAGPGFFLVGDAATFIDPIFSTGVTLGLMSADQVAREVRDVLEGRSRPAAARRRYRRYLRGSTRPYFRIVESYYDHPFREIFLEGQGPLQIHRAVIALLAGHVFPRPVFAVRWRVFLFHLVVRLQRWGIPIAPRKPNFSLLRTAAGG